MQRGEKESGRTVLEQVVMSNLRRIRTAQGKTQKEFSQFCGFKDHSAYTKKETGQSVIDLRDMNDLLEHTGASLLDLFLGHPKLTYPNEALSKKAVSRWPFMKTFIEQVNRTAEQMDEVNLDFLIANLAMITARIKELVPSRVEATKKNQAV